MPELIFSNEGMVGTEAIKSAITADTNPLPTELAGWIEKSIHCQLLLVLSTITPFMFGVQRTEMNLLRESTESQLYRSRPSVSAG
mmetsp:Transcript_9408/g.13730  ORF Transcript_9408/g.13730 Transcript_9408/m.13730 type:complete len:85 (-) Transcript_9408:1414-1668(-)